MNRLPFLWSDAEVELALRGLELDEPGANPSRTDEASRRESFVYTGVSTDTRSLRPGELFVALVGETFDGHDFVERAFDRGAGAAVVSRSLGGESRDDRRLRSPRPIFRVADTLAALGALAARRRKVIQAPLAGITGSSGKTTTKEFAAAILSASLNVHVTRGNYNNRIGLPLTLLAVPDDAEAVVVEMGTSEPGEIAALAAIASPDLGAVTTVAESHLDKLRSFEGVLREKLSLLAALPSGSPAPVVGDEPAILAERARMLRPDVRVAGTSDRADGDLRATAVQQVPSGGGTFSWRGRQVSLAVPGSHAVTDALVALAVAEGLGSDAELGAARLAEVRPGAMRSELRVLGGLELVVDCYNSNPQSLTAALDLLLERRRVRSQSGAVAILGTMLELGDQSAKLHESALEDALSRDIDLVVATGEFSLAAERMDSNGRRVIRSRDWRNAYRVLRPRLVGDETILLKASRGVALEGVVRSLENDFPDPSAPSAEEGDG